MDAGRWRTPTPGTVARRLTTTVLQIALAAACLLSGCADEEDAVDAWDSDEWEVVVTVEDDHLLISATVADAHGDFIHVSIRRQGHDNRYSIERSPSPRQEERDWSRVHHWFGELHPDTYLEGRIDDGSGRGPNSFRTFTFALPRAASASRDNYPDLDGGEYEYITRGYGYADDNAGHPAFDPGSYEIVIYPWYTGSANDLHPASDGRSGVQYLHYEHPLASSEFVIE